MDAHMGSFALTLGFKTSAAESETWPAEDKVRHHRSFGGCDWCRKRRRKCDEGRPSCSLCARLGRECHYRDLRVRVFEPHDPKPAAALQAPIPAILSEERRAFDSAVGIPQALHVPMGTVAVRLFLNDDPLVRRVTSNKENSGIFSLYHALSRVADGTPSQIMSEAYSMHVLSRLRGDGDMHRASLGLYSRALRQMRPLLGQSRQGTSMEVLRSALWMEQFELLLPPESSRYKDHLNGIALLLERLGPDVVADPANTAVLRYAQVLVMMQHMMGGEMGEHGRHRIHLSQGGDDSEVLLDSLLIEAMRVDATASKWLATPEDARSGFVELVNMATQALQRHRVWWQLILKKQTIHEFPAPAAAGAAARPGRVFPATHMWFSSSLTATQCTSAALAQLIVGRGLWKCCRAMRTAAHASLPFVEARMEYFASECHRAAEIMASTFPFYTGQDPPAGSERGLTRSFDGTPPGNAIMKVLGASVTALQVEMATAEQRVFFQQTVRDMVRLLGPCRPAWVPRWACE